MEVVVQYDYISTASVQLLCICLERAPQATLHSTQTSLNLAKSLELETKWWSSTSRKSTCYDQQPTISHEDDRMDSLIRKQELSSS